MACEPLTVLSTLSGGPSGKNAFHDNIKMLIAFHSVDICSYDHTRAMMLKQLVPQHESRHQNVLAVIILDEAVAIKALIQLNLKS